MAIKLTQELKDFVSRPEVVKVLATVNEDGSPNVGPKMTIHVFDDESLAYAEVTGKRHWRNVRQDARVAIACIDWQKMEGYRFVGEAEVHREGDVFERINALIPPKFPRPQAAMRLPISEVYTLSFRSPGERLL